MNALDALQERASTRAFLDRAVDRKLIERVLDAARWAPSGVNIQPWQVAVVQGESKRALGEALIAVRESGQKQTADYQYYPSEWVEPYKSRRRASGLALYEALGIGREDTERQKAAWYANYRFFDAPVGLLFFMDRQLGQGAWLDMGMFIQSVMLAARTLGLATCPQASLAEYAETVRGQLGIGPENLLLCGMALGYADPQHPVNRYRTEREPVAAFTRWFD